MTYDFSDCKFINENMRFYTYLDFCDNCEDLKKKYLSSNENVRLFYKWYVYANIHMNETFKNAIWDFLNCDEKECYLYLLKLKKNYKVK